MINELVSVIITTYKRPYEILYRAINSVINQTYSNLEIIIVDDSPNDYSKREEIKENIQEIYDSRISYIQHEFNRGGCAARNTGIRNSHGNLIAFLDDDDEWGDNKIELQLKAIEKENADFVYCAYKEVTEINEKIIKTQVKINNYDKKTYYNDLLCENYIGSVSFVMIKKKCFDSCGDFNEQLKSCQDWDMWIRILRKYKLCYIEEALVLYHKHENERISTNCKNQLQGHKYILDNYQKYMKDNPKIIRINMYRLSKIYADNKNFKQAYKMWFYANRIDNINIRESIYYALRIIKRILVS